LAGGGFDISHVLTDHHPRAPTVQNAWHGCAIRVQDACEDRKLTGSWKAVVFWGLDAEHHALDNPAHGSKGHGSPN